MVSPCQLIPAWDSASQSFGAERTDTASPNGSSGFRFYPYQLIPAGVNHCSNQYLARAERSKRTYLGHRGLTSVHAKLILPISNYLAPAERCGRRVMPAWASTSDVDRSGWRDSVVTTNWWTGVGSCHLHRQGSRLCVVPVFNSRG